MIRGRSVLVAGGTGLVGTSLVRRLHELGAHVRATCLTRRPAFLADRYRRLDLTVAESCVEATRDMDTVFVCAAQTVGAGGLADDPAGPLQANLRIRAGLLDACRRNRVRRVVLVSSSTVYHEAPHPLREEELDLNRPVHPLYQGEGWLWRYVEQLARFYHDRYGLGLGIVRPTAVYGPYDEFAEGRSHVVPALVRRAVAREEPFVVWGTGEAVRDFLYVEDLAGDLVAVAERDWGPAPVNLAGGAPLAIRDAAATVLEAAGHRVRPRFDPTRPEAIRYRVLDTRRADALLGHRARTAFRDGVAATVRWYREASEPARGERRADAAVVPA